MGDVELPPKAVLEAADQSFEWAREMRKGVAGRQRTFMLHMADRMAAQIRDEFPGERTGRLVMATADAINALADYLPELGVTPSLDVLMCVASLAAEQLDRDAAPEQVTSDG